MKTIAGSALVSLCVGVDGVVRRRPDSRWGALAIDEGQGDQYGWAAGL